MIKFSIVLFKKDKQIGKYIVNEELFSLVKKKIEPYRTCTQQSKAIKCIETGQVFKNAKAAANCLIEEGITGNYRSHLIIRKACHGKQEKAYGYHWEYAKEELNKIRV